MLFEEPTLKDGFDNSGGAGTTRVRLWKRQLSGTYIQIPQTENPHERDLGPPVDLNIVEHEHRQRGKDDIRGDVDGY